MQSPTPHKTPSAQKRTPSRKPSIETYHKCYVGHDVVIRQLKHSLDITRYSCKGMRICRSTGNLVQCWARSQLIENQKLLDGVAPRLGNFSLLAEDDRCEFYIELLTRMLLCVVCSETQNSRERLSADWDSLDEPDKTSFFKCVRLAYTIEYPFSRPFSFSNKRAVSSNDMLGNYVHQDDVGIDNVFARKVPYTTSKVSGRSYLRTPAAELERRPRSAGSTPSKIPSTQQWFATQMSGNDPFRTSRGVDNTNNKHAAEDGISDAFSRLDVTGRDIFTFRVDSCLGQNKEQKLASPNEDQLSAVSSMTNISRLNVNKSTENKTSSLPSDIETCSTELHTLHDKDYSEFQSMTPSTKQEGRNVYQTPRTRTKSLSQSPVKADKDIESVTNEIESEVTSISADSLFPSSPATNAAEPMYPFIEYPVLEGELDSVSAFAPVVTDTQAGHTDLGTENGTAEQKTVTTRRNTPDDVNTRGPAHKSASTSAVFQLNKSYKIPREIDNDLRDELLRTTAREGYVYVLQAPQYFQQRGTAPLVKIGMAVDVAQRIKDLSREFGMEDLRQVDDDQSFAHPLYKKVERLAHVELANFQRDLESCKPGKKKKKKKTTTHREWFEVAPEVAVQVVQRWRRFLHNSPYTVSGVLRSPWTDLLEWPEMPFLPREEMTTDHESRNNRWEDWLKKGIDMSRSLRERSSS